MILILGSITLQIFLRLNLRLLNWLSC